MIVSVLPSLDSAIKEKTNYSVMPDCPQQYGCQLSWVNSMVTSKIVSLFTL